MKALYVLALFAVLCVVRGQQYFSGGLISAPYSNFDTVGTYMGGSRFGQGWMGSINSILSEVVSGFGSPQPFIGSGFGQRMAGGFGEVIPITSGGFGGFSASQGITGLSGIGGLGGISGGITFGEGIEGGRYPPGSFIGPAPDFLSGDNTNDVISRGDISNSWGRGDVIDTGFSRGGSGPWVQTVNPGFSFGSSNSWGRSGVMDSGFSLGSSNSWSQGNVASSPIY
ncbi:PE-PGRS family protein PE_PGRS47-like [Saccostrea echinata]|uniref:PE-PGRS family protein PE_PGRS47-like n=1 Tax=Saccostrea echinata TaxID=191078 RepID=UPI002A82AC78|nr:PE-PGRS family protein PE_PGRS47-like [Saccostrea echinata]